MGRGLAGEVLANIYSRPLHFRNLRLPLSKLGRGVENDTIRVEFAPEEFRHIRIELTRDDDFTWRREIEFSGAQHLRHARGRRRETLRDGTLAQYRAERALRPSVIFRKVTNGFRSEWGAKTDAAFRSVVSTAKLNNRSVLADLRLALATASPSHAIQ